MSNVFDPTIRALGRSLDLRLENQNVIASNIANADTPGYKAKAMDFEQELRAALGNEGLIKLEGDDPNHLTARDPASVEAKVYDDANGIESLDGNTVDRANEMVKMKENEIIYNAAVEALKKKIAMLEYGVNEGGGNR